MRFRRDYLRRRVNAEMLRLADKRNRSAQAPLPGQEQDKDDGQGPQRNSTQSVPGLLRPKRAILRLFFGPAPFGNLPANRYLPPSLGRPVHKRRLHKTPGTA